MVPATNPRVVQTILEQEIKPVLIGNDPAFPKRLRADLWKATEYQGVQGLGQFEGRPRSGFPPFEIVQGTFSRRDV